MKKKGILRRGLTRAYKRKAQIIMSKLQWTNTDYENNKVLEIGAGSGLMTYYFSQLYKGEIVVTDLSSEMLKTASKRIKRKNISFLAADASNLPFEDNIFDAVVGVDIIHHLGDPESSMHEWLRVIKPDGKLVFLETNPYNPLNLRNIGVEHEVRSFLNTPKNLIDWLIQAGWKYPIVSPSPSFTPAGPKFLHPLLNILDYLFCKIPLLNKLTALWTVQASKSVLFFNSLQVFGNLMQQIISIWKTRY